MDNKISLEELKDYLWQCAVLLRTNIDAGAYKQYIFPLMFFKRICDVYDEECEKILVDTNGDLEALEFEENHTFIIKKGYHWNDLRETSENIGKKIVECFKEIEKSNPDKLLGVFGDASWTNKNRLSDELLKDLIEQFSTQKLTLKNCPEDELGQGYEYLIKKFADDSGHTAQEFYTNRTVVHLMTELLKPQPGESIYDPTCGSGGMLISCIAYLKDKNLEWRNVKIYGQEINQLTSSIGRMNLFLHGVKDFYISNDDTLKRPAFIENNKLKQFNLILANPPYSISQWDRNAFSNDKYGRNFLGVPPQGRADYAFIQHILKSMDEHNGRAAILLPHGILTRNDEKLMRQKMIELDLIECVIGIAKNLFFNSPMEACILICKSNKEKNRIGKIQFIDAKDLFIRKNAQSYLLDNHIEQIADVYNNCIEKEGFSTIVSIEEIKEKNYSLGIPQYFRKQSNVSDAEINLIDDYNDYKMTLNETFNLYNNIIEKVGDYYD